MGSALTPQFFLGPVVYFIVFLFAYGFEDRVTPTDHVAFLCGIALSALAVSPIAAARVSSRHGRYLPSLVFCFLAALAFHASIIAVGVVVSGLYEEQGSVTSSWGLPTYVVTVAVLAACAALAARAARRALLRVG